ncbi:MAG: thioredoxin [Planctomycetota bacterium]|nr:thioredoxin [Planctomycetota bacterium]
MANLAAFTDENFDTEVNQSDLPVLVDFGAAWCGPCRALAPIVEGLATDYQGRLKVGTVDIDKAPGIARNFQIMSVPTIIFFKGGEVVDKINGLQSKANLQKRIDAVIA